MADDKRVTQTEQDGLVGKATREHQAALREVACIQLKARSLSNHLREIAERLKLMADGKAMSLPNLEEYPSPDELVELQASYRETNRRVAESENDLRRLGIKSISYLE